MSEQELVWHRVADLDELPPGRVKTVTADVHSMALTNIDGEYTAMENRCPHQGLAEMPRDPRQHRVERLCRALGLAMTSRPVSDRQALPRPATA